MGIPNKIDGAFQLAYTVPGPVYFGTKTAIEALTGIQSGAFAIGYTTTLADGQFGFYDGSAWRWGFGVVEYIDFDTAGTSNPEVEGRVSWNPDEGTLDVGVGDGIILQVGQELFFNVKNQSGATITNGTPVMFDGTLGASGKLLIQEAIADGSLDPEYIMGLVTHDIDDGEDGKVTWFGKVRGIDTSGSPYGETWADGDLLWVSQTTAGYLTNVEPASGQKILVAAVVYAHATQGTLLVRPSWNTGGTSDTSGWIPVSQTWTYASADAPVYQIYVSGDVTADPNYKLGNKVKCDNNSTTAYGFIVKVGAYDGGNDRTPVDIYCGTDYSLANSAITDPTISKVKSPDGFPLNPEKWTVSLTNTSNLSQASPTVNTYYNVGSINIDIPIGAWNLYYSWTANIVVTTTALRAIGLVSALSTATGSVSDNELRMSQQITGPTGANNIILIATRSKTLVVTSKTRYYPIVLGSVVTDAISSIAIRGDLNTTVVKAVCAYL